MTQPQLRDLVKASNPVVTHQLLPDERVLRTLYDEAMQRAGNPQTSVDLLEQPVERRREMQTQERPIEVVRKPEARRPRRRLIPALAGALAVIAIAVGVWALTSNPEPEFADWSPLQLTDSFNEGVISGDWAGVRDVLAPEATYQITTSGGGTPVIRFADEIPPGAGVEDWDGDGVVTEYDGFATLGAEIYSGGITSFLSCTQPDAFTAVCEEAREGYAFFSPSHSATWTVSVSDGLVTAIVIDLVGNGVDALAVNQYRLWVGENRPDVKDQLFNSFNERILTPDTVELHRELATEWLATQ